MVDLGIPSAPPPVLAPRRKSRQLKVGSVLVGGDAPVSDSIDVHHTYR